MSGKNCVYILSSLLCAGAVIAEAQEKSVFTPPQTIPPSALAPNTVPAPAPAPVPVKQQDFGKGFATLFQMGLPRLEGARPASINIYNSLVSTNDYGIGHGGSQIIGWIKAAEKNTEPVSCIVGGVFECKLYDHAALMKIQSDKMKKIAAKKLSKRQMFSMMMPEHNCFSGKWKMSTPAKTAEDIKKLLQSKDNEYMFKSDKSKYGLLLLQAAQLYESGAKAEANEIAGMLFKAGGSKEVLQAAINVLAESKYLRAYCDFIESQDWGKFNTDLEGIIGKFKNNWEDVRYVKAVQAAVAARVKNPALPALPALKTSTPLSKADLELVAELSKINQDDYNNSGMMYGCWLLTDNKSKDDADKEQQVPNVLDKIKAGGIKSVPLLIAMLDDDWLLSFKDRNGYSRRMFRNDSEDNENEQKADKKQEADLTEAAGRLELPMTRGQLARKMLEPLIIPENKEQEYTIIEKKGEEFKALAVAWYEAVKKLDAKGLQNKYLCDGSESQKALVLDGMIAGVDDTTAPLIEKALLESDSSMMNQDLLIRYCDIRKEKAKPFIEKLRTKCYQQLDKQFSGQVQNQEAMPSKEKAKEMMDKFFDQLNQSKPKASLEDVVKEMLTTTDEEGFMLIARNFARAAKDQPAEKIYQICLDSAVQAKDPKQKLFLLYMLQMPHEGKQKSKLDIAKFKVQLEKLLADQSVLPERYGGKQVIPLITACMIEATAKEKLEGKAGESANMQELSALYGHWDNKCTQYLIRRAKAILNGTSADKLPVLVNADDLKDTQIKEAKTKIAGKSEAEIKDYCNNAQLEDLIPLGAAIQQDNQLNVKLLPLANQIVEVDTDIPELKEQLAKFKGKTLNEQILQEIIKFAENCMQNDNIVDVSLLRRSCMQGMVLTLSRSQAKQGTGNSKRIHGGMGGASGRRMLRAYLAFSGSSNEGMSRVVKVKNKPQEKNLDQKLAENVNEYTESNDDQKEQEKKFIEAFNTAFLKDGNALWSGRIIINGMEY